MTWKIKLHFLFRVLLSIVGAGFTIVYIRLPLPPSGHETFDLLMFGFALGILGLIAAAATPSPQFIPLVLSGLFCTGFVATWLKLAYQLFVPRSLWAWFLLACWAFNLGAKLDRSPVPQGSIKSVTLGFTQEIFLARGGMGGMGSHLIILLTTCRTATWPTEAATGCSAHR
jgi:hypothetical protein